MHPVRAPSRAPFYDFFETTKYALILCLFYFEDIKLMASERSYIIVRMARSGIMTFKQQWVRPYVVTSNMAAVSSVTWQILVSMTSREDPPLSAIASLKKKSHEVSARKNNDLLRYNNKCQREGCIQRPRPP